MSAGNLFYTITAHKLSINGQTPYLIHFEEYPASSALRTPVPSLTGIIPSGNIQLNNNVMH